MARTIEVEIEVGSKQALKSLNDLEQAQEQILEQLKQTDIGTAEYARLQKQLKRVGSEVKDLELGFEALDKEQRAAALVDSFTGLAGAVGAVSGAFIAFGVESDAIEEAEKKLLGILTVVSSLRDVSDGVVAAGKLIGPAFSNATSAIKGAGAALAGLGIGALIGGVTLLITYWDDLTELISGSPAEKRAKALDETIARIEDENDLLAVQIDNYISLGQNVGYLQAQIDGLIDGIDESTKAINRQNEALEEELRKQTEGSEKYKEIQGQIDENNKRLLQNNAKLLAAQRKYVQVTIQGVEEEYKERLALAQAAGENTIDLEIEQTEKKLEEVKRASTTERRIINDLTIQLKALRVKRDKETAETRKRLKQQEIDALNELELLQFDYLLELNDEEEKAAGITLQRRRTELAQSLELELQNFEGTATEKKAIEDKFRLLNLIAERQYYRELDTIREGSIQKIVSENEDQLSSVEKQTERRLRLLDKQYDDVLSKFEGLDIETFYEKVTGDDAEFNLQSFFNTAVDDIKDALKRIDNLTDISGLDPEAAAAKQIEIARKVALERVKVLEEEELEKAKILENTILELEQQRIDEITQVGLTREEIEKINKRYDEQEKKLRDDANEDFQKTQDEKKEIIEKLANDEVQIEKTKNQKLEQQRQESLSNFQAYIQAAADLTSFISDTVVNNIEANINRQQALLEQQLEAGIISQEVYDARSNDLAKEAFEANKRASIAQATIATIQGAVNAYSSSLKFDPTGLTGSILAAAALAAGFAQVRNIESQTFEGNASRSTTNVGVSTGGSFNVLNPFQQQGGGTNVLPPRVQQTTTGGGADVIDTTQGQGGGQRVIKTYVLAGDVTTAQAADAKIRQQRKL